MTNFDFLTTEKQFDAFSSVCVMAEKTYSIDIESCSINCRRALEFSIKWLYSADTSLVMPYEQNLANLMNTEEFRDLVGNDLLNRIHYIRKVGNTAVHGNKKVSADMAMLCLQNLFVFMDFVATCYILDYKGREFDRSLLSTQRTVPIVEFSEGLDLEKLIEENQALRKELTARREQQQKYYITKPLELSEYKTRKLYIDAMLMDAGWTEGKDWINEVELSGMPNHSGVGFADYVLYGNDGIALAVIEAKRTCVDLSKGRQQAKLYADILEKKHGRRPVIFLSNGFETSIDESTYPERKVATIYSKRDLEKLFNLRTLRTDLRHIRINPTIAGRYYQEGAVKAVCEAFGARNRRKALLVMATGSGKTRTIISLCDVLLQNGWIKNILFLADRNSLVTQAKRNFVNLLPDLSVTNLCEDKDNYSAHCVFSTYQTMIHCIDDIKDDEGKLFTTGHFDLVICDEAHRSIYNKYKDIFTYFDAPLIGLTATPKDEIDKNTYSIFELENGVPTYGYDLAQAVKDGWLVDYVSVETKLKFLEEGIVYDELSDEEKEDFEETFKDENGKIPEIISSSKLNEWVFNEDTIKQVLHILMSKAIKIDYESKIGKTIIFAKNHTHAEKIYSVFNKEYPNLKGYAKVIDNYTNYVQSAIDDFSDPTKLPQIAISVDMLDTGIDIPEVLNLVFFKKVMSKAKFWQMIGRGTRLCPNLIDGVDKSEFYIFDFCNNFEFFRMNKGKQTAITLSVQGAIFNLKFQMAYKLQDLEYQISDLIEFRKVLVHELIEKVKELNRNNFAVKQHLKYVDIYSNKQNYEALSYENTLQVNEEIAPLILPYEDEPSSIRFDALLYGLELAYLIGQKYPKAKKDLVKKISLIASISNIPEIMVKSELIKKILHSDYLENADINKLEYIRINLRHLMKYIPKEKIRYNTDFQDTILSIDWNESELENDDLKNYKAKAEYYIRQHQDNSVIVKLKTNVPLNNIDIKYLEDILWGEIGSKEDYEKEYGQKPLGELVREIVGLDMNAAKIAFSDFLMKYNLDTNQIYFVNQIIEYIVHNGMLKDLSVLQESPFIDKGRVVDLFTDLSVWNGLRNVIDQINSNALV